MTQSETSLRKNLHNDEFWKDINPDLADEYLETLKTIERQIIEEKGFLSQSIKRLPKGSNDELHNKERTKLNRERRAVSKRKAFLKTLKTSAVDYLDPHTINNAIINAFQTSEALRAAIIEHKAQSEDAGIDPEDHDVQLWSLVN